MVGGSWVSKASLRPCVSYWLEATDKEYSTPSSRYQTLHQFVRLAPPSPALDKAVHDRAGNGEIDRKLSADLRSVGKSLDGR